MIYLLKSELKKILKNFPERKFTERGKIAAQKCLQVS